MLDQNDSDSPADAAPDQFHGDYHPQYDQQHGQHIPPTSDYYQAAMSGPPVSQPHMQTSGPPGTEDQFASIGEMIDPNDPMLDADPFGLSASMHYPTSYSFEQPPHR